MRWVTRLNKKCIEITKLKEKDKLWSVIVRKGNSKKDLRILGKLTKKQVRKSEADKHTRDILQGFVVGKFK